MKSYENIFTVMLVGVAFLLVGLLAGCRSSREVVETTNTEQHESYTHEVETDTLAAHEGGHVEQSDTAAASVNDRGTIEIKRDSTGRPVFIVFDRAFSLRANSTQTQEKNRWFYGLNATRHSEASGTSDTIAEKTEEAKTEVDPSIPLECLIGTTLLGLVILYVIYVIIADYVWPSIKNRKR